MFIKLLFFIIGALLIIRGCFWFREQNIQPEYDDDQQISEPIYDCIVLFFLDATGYRYISNQIKDPVFQTLNEIDRMIQKHPKNTFLVKTKAIPPSTDYTILSIITGVKQMWNYLDVIFKKQPDKREDSLLKRNLKTALLSSKKIDWIKMTTGTFDFIGNSRLFTLDNIEQADYSTYDLFRKIYSQNEYQLIINHFMGYDALGHALQYQSFKQGINLFELYNNAIKDITKNLRQNDLLIIIGDHDQSKKGKHYQCTEESKECDGFIFAYSKKQRKQWAIYDHYESADLSATILALLGQRPTLQNMGKIIPQFFPSDIPSSRIKDFQKITKRLMIRQLYHQGFRQKYINQLEKYKEDDIFPIIQQNYYLGNIDILFVMLGIILLLFSFEFNFNSYFILLLYFLTNLHYYFFEILFPIIILYYRQQQFKGSLIRFLILIGCVCLYQIYQTPKEINFLLLLVSKRIFIQKLNIKPPNKQILMEFMALISQILVYCFYVFKSIQSEIVYTLLGMVIIFCFINPKVFNKDKNKLLYILIIFIFSDIQSCFQFNENQLFVQQILYFALLNPQNSEEVIIFAQVLHRYLNPIYIKDNQGQGLQINMNSMMILVQDFQVGPSLFSMIYGTFGMLIVSRFILLISKQKVSQEFIFGRVFGGLVINIIVLICFYHDLTANIEDQVQSLFMIPKLIMELVIYLF